MNEPMTVRFATEEDAPVVYRFIRKMAEYEKLEHEVDTSEEALRRSVFRERQAEVILGEVAGRPVGFALFFHNFSTFRGQRGLYLAPAIAFYESLGAVRMEQWSIFRLTEERIRELSGKQ